MIAQSRERELKRMESRYQHDMYLFEVWGYKRSVGDWGLKDGGRQRHPRAAVI